MVWCRSCCADRSFLVPCFDSASTGLEEALQLRWIRDLGACFLWSRSVCSGIQSAVLKQCSLLLSEMMLLGVDPGLEIKDVNWWVVCLRAPRHHLRWYVLIENAVLYDSCSFSFKQWVITFYTVKLHRYILFFFHVLLSERAILFIYIVEIIEIYLSYVQ